MRVLGTIVLVGMLSFGGGGIYVVRAGDTLGAIAKRAGTSVASLVRSNGLRDADLIRTGQRLTIPDAGSGPTAAPPGTYVVRPGDTLAVIAARTGVPAATIAAANGLVGPTLYAGVRLRLAPLTGPRGEVLDGPNVGGGAPAGGGVHVVTRGETLGAIARRNQTSVASIVAANGLRDADVIRIGQRLTIPGGWRCPVVGKLRYVNDWGFPRGSRRAHEGIDLLADRGTPVVAPVAGIATQKIGSVGGRQVTLKGDDGFVYINSHLNSFAKAGRVAPGDLIGRIGTSGNAAGGPPHVHFEIHPGGIGPVNPYPTILAACGA